MVREYRNPNDEATIWSPDEALTSNGAPSTVRRKTLHFTLTISSEKRAGNLSREKNFRRTYSTNFEAENVPSFVML